MIRSGEKLPAKWEKVGLKSLSVAFLRKRVLGFETLASYVLYTFSETLFVLPTVHSVDR